VRFYNDKYNVLQFVYNGALGSKFPKALINGKPCYVSGNYVLNPEIHLGYIKPLKAIEPLISCERGKQLIGNSIQSSIYNTQSQCPRIFNLNYVSE